MSNEKMMYMRALIVGATERAIKVNVTEYENERGGVETSCGQVVWLARSKIRCSEPPAMTSEIEIEVPDWIMRDKGLI